MSSAFKEDFGYDPKKLEATDEKRQEALQELHKVQQQFQRYEEQSTELKNIISPHLNNPESRLYIIMKDGLDGNGGPILTGERIGEIIGEGYEQLSAANEFYKKMQESLQAMIDPMMLGDKPNSKDYRHVRRFVNAEKYTLPTFKDEHDFERMLKFGGVQSEESHIRDVFDAPDSWDLRGLSGEIEKSLGVLLTKGQIKVLNVKSQARDAFFK